MSNTLITNQVIANTAVSLAKNSNAFIQNIDTQYDSLFGIEGAKVGDTAKIRLPNEYVTTRGPALSLQDTNEQYTSLTLAYQDHVDLGFTSKERTLSVMDFTTRYVMPAMNNLLGTVAATVMAGVEGGVCNAVFKVDGSNNTIAPTATEITLANAILSDNSAQTYDRNLVAAPRTMAKMVVALSGLFNPQGDISKQYKSAQIYNALNFAWFEDQTVLAHTTGTFTAGTVNGAGQSGTTLVTNAITGTLKKGDIITIAGSNAINRVTRQSLNVVRQFVVTANVLTSATSIPIYPAIIAGGVGYDPVSGTGGVQYQTVDYAPANSAAISLANKAGETYKKNIAFAPQAVTMATADLVIPDAGAVAKRANKDGISVRVLTAYVPGTDQQVTRVDVLHGNTWVKPEWAVIVGDATT